MLHGWQLEKLAANPSEPNQIFDLETSFTRMTSRSNKGLFL